MWLQKELFLGGRSSSPWYILELEFNLKNLHLFLLQLIIGIQTNFLWGLWKIFLLNHRQAHVEEETLLLLLLNKLICWVPIMFDVAWAFFFFFFLDTQYLILNGSKATFKILQKINSQKRETGVIHWRKRKKWWFYIKSIWVSISHIYNTKKVPIIV